MRWAKSGLSGFKVKMKGNIMLKRQAALVISLCSMFLSATTMATEEAEYTVLLKEENLEVRQYEPQIVAETVVRRQLG